MCHELVGSTINLRGYSSLYAKRVSTHYLGLVLLEWDKYYPQVVYNDHCGRFYAIELLIIVRYKVGGDLCPNQVIQHLALQGSLF